MTRQVNDCPIEIVDGQLHELGPRSTVDVENPELRRRIMLEVTLSVYGCSRR